MSNRLVRIGLLTLGVGPLATVHVKAAEVYQWTDDSGRKVFSSTAPKDRPVSKATIKVAPAKASAPSPANALGRADNGGIKPAPAAPQAPPPDPARAAHNCAEAQRVLQVLDSTPRPRFTDSDGQIKFMDEAQKSSQRAEARRQIEENCR